jgi:hypothetical protein
LTTTLLADGTVLLDGFTGRPDGSRPRATFIYDPATETFDPATEPPPPFTPPTQAQVSGTATLLLDGRVLIVGGGGNVGRTRASKTAELFQ